MRISLTRAHNVFAVVMFFKTSESVIGTWKTFLTHFTSEENSILEKAVCVSVTDSPVLKNISSVNTQCAQV